MRNVINFEQVKLSCRQCSLAELCLPRGLSSEDLAKFELLVEQLSPLNKGKTLYRAGDSTSSLFAIRSGSLKSVVTTEDGEEQIVGFHLPGELVGFDGVDSAHSCNVVSLERTTVCELPTGRLKELSATLPSLQGAICSLMSNEISREQSMLLLLAKRTAESRLATFILNLSRRMRERGFSENKFLLPMSRHDIANYLGLAAETISRLLARFQNEGIVETSGREIDILDAIALEEKITGSSNQSLAQSD